MQITRKKVTNHTGLRDEDVLKSREKFGQNIISSGKRKTFLTHYLASFGDPTIKILLVALGLNVIFFMENFNWFESVGILICIMLATLVSSISEYGSQLAFEKLMEDAQKIICKVWRNNEICELNTSEIVVGDYVQLQAGDKIPADGILIDGELDVDQSSLNGESKEAHKKPILNSRQYENKNLNFSDEYSLFNGSIVCQGEGTMLVKSIGDFTFYGELAKELQEDSQESPLKQRLGVLAGSISKFGYFGALFIVIATMFKSIVIDNGFNTANIIAYVTNPYMLMQDVIRAVTFGITVIVVAVPEGLPVMITVVLSSNMKRMIKDNVLVRKLVGIETAGSLNILFTDKTGTLTQGKLQVSRFITGDCKTYTNIAGLSKEEELWKLIYISSVFNNSSKLGYDGDNHVAIGGNSTDRSILSFATTYPLPNININIDSSIPFDSKIKYSLASISGDLNTTLIKGAPEKIIPFCSSYYDSQGHVISLKNKSNINKMISDMACQGIRVLVLATSNCSTEELSSKNFNNLTLIGVIGIRDEIRENVSESVKKVLNAGVQVVMMTGDGRDTAKSIATEAGLYKEKKNHIILTSDELNALTDEEVKKILPSLRVIARALPTDKSRLIRISQAMGLVAGMTGDGVNDAPALKKADVGFSMGSGTEIAKEASDIVILDDNFLSIGKSILYGRTIFKSIRKFIIFQLSINVCAVGISLIGQFIGVETPITVIQMLWVNMVMDTLAGLAFAGESPLPEYMEETPKRKDETIINKYMANQILTTGIYTSILCILFLKHPVIYNNFRYSSENNFLMTGFFALFMFCALFNSLNARTQRLHLLSHLGKNKAFIAIMGLATIVQFILLYHGGSVFRTYGLTPKELFIVLSMAFTVIPVDLMRKSILRLHHSKDEIAKFL